MSFFEFVEELIFDSFKSHIQNIVDNKKAKELIANYIKREEKDLESCSLNEEIDFQGFCICLKDSLISDIRKCITSHGADQDRLQDRHSANGKFGF